MTVHSPIQTPLPSPRLIDRIMGDDIIFAYLIGLTAWTGYRWWFVGDPWIAFLAFGLMAMRSVKAIDKLKQVALFSMDDPRPSLFTRIIGQDVLGIPIVLVFGALAFGVPYSAMKAHMPLHPTMVGLVLAFLFPVLVAIRAIRARRRWYRAQEPEAKPTTPAAAPPRIIPEAAPLTPIASFSVPSVPEAMQRLPPQLLALVRDGAIAFRQGAGA